MAQAIRRRNEVQKALQVLRKRDAEQAKQLAEHNRASAAGASHFYYPHPASPSALCPLGASTINLLVHWGAAAGGSANGALAGAQQRIGQHHVRNLVIRPQVKLAAIEHVDITVQGCSVH